MKSPIPCESRTLLVALLMGFCSLPQLRAADRNVPADYPTIQAAVDASNPGDTIRIAARDYYEQTVIADKGNLTLVGEPGAEIYAWNGMTQTLAPHGSTAIVSLGLVRSDVVIAGLTFHGESLGDLYPNAFYGILFRGSSGQVTNCTVKDFRTLDSATVARGINVVNLVSFGTPVVDVTILNSTFANNARSINLAGDDGNANATLLRTRFTIEGNTFTGFGPTSGLVNYGIVIFTGAGGDVKSNTMTDYSYAGAATGFSSAIHAFDGSTNRPYVPVRPVRYEGNIFSTNDHHLVMVSANDSLVVSNAFQGVGSGVRRWGSLAFSGTNVVVAQNDFSDMAIGVELFGGDLNGSVLRGVATNPKLQTNRFCKVYTPIHAQPLANGIQEEGTELCTNAPALRVIQVPAEYATIQEAVNAADPGDTILIAAGDYYEQVTIANKGRLNLVGEPGTVIHAPQMDMAQTLLPYNWPWYQLVAIYRTEVVISGITLEGHQLGDLYQGPLTGLIGIYFLGSSGHVTNCTVNGFRGTTLTTETDACALQVWNPVETGSSEVNFSVCSSTFADNETSLLLRGDPVANPAIRRVTALAKENSITGLGPVPFPNQGVWIVCGVTGHVIANRLTDHGSAAIDAYDAAAQSHTRFISLQPLNFEGNILSNNVQHLRTFGGNENRVINNVFLSSGPTPQNSAGVVLSGTNIVAANNDFSDRPLGISLLSSGAWEDWPAFPPAARPTLAANWFCNVPEPIRVDTNLVIGVQEQGTELCENGPMQPVFQSIRNSNGAGATLTLRAWHGDSVVIESSANLETNLVNWVPVHTNVMSLPTFEFHDTNDVGAAQRFYRAMRP